MKPRFVTKCVMCNINFLARQRDGKYCSKKCRQKAVNVKKGEAKIERPPGWRLTESKVAELYNGRRYEDIKLRS